MVVGRMTSQTVDQVSVSKVVVDIDDPQLWGIPWVLKFDFDSKLEAPDFFSQNEMNLKQRGQDN